MSFSRRKPPAPPPASPPPPTPEEVLDVIDEISGTKTITVQRPDGKKERRTMRLPRTPEQEAYYTRAASLMNTALERLQSLYEQNPRDAVNYQPFIDTFANLNAERQADLAQIGLFPRLPEMVSNYKAMATDLVNREFDRANRMNEERLARTGLATSSIAADARAALEGERIRGLRESEIMGERYGSELANSQLAREREIFGLREQGREGRLREAATAYQLEQDKRAELEASRQRAIAENQGLLQQGRLAQDEQRALSSTALQAENMAQSAAANRAAQSLRAHESLVAQRDGEWRRAIEHFRATPATFGQSLGQFGQYIGGRAAAAMLPSLKLGSPTPRVGSKTDADNPYIAGTTS